MAPEYAKLLAQPTVSITECGRVLGYSRNPTYTAANVGEIPTIKLGGKRRVPTAWLREKLGLKAEAA